MLYKQILQNKRKTLFLVALFSVLVLLLGWAIGYLVNNDSITGIIITIVVLAVYIPITYMTASSQVLNFSGPKKSRKENNPDLFKMFKRFSMVARLPSRKVYMLINPQLNAFATDINPSKISVA